VIRVGANHSVTEKEEKPTRIYRTDPRVENERINAVKELKRHRDNDKVKRALENIKSLAALPATAENNLMPAIVDAVRLYATNGEVMGALKEVWGQYTPRSLV
jgi:methylmalonyl-CoA mutase N-terminal domain/subunit